MKTEIKTRKIVPLCRNTEAKINLFTGENIIEFTDVIDKSMGVKISHLLNQNGSGENNYCCGSNMRLNLHETFVKNSDSSVDADYVYTNSMGDTYCFKEYYNYVNSSGSKRRIDDKTKVTVLEDGSLIYNNGTRTFPVEREVVTYDGLKASTKLEGVKNVAFYEQRIDELKQAEEEYDSYKRAFSDYVICDENGNIKTELTAPSYKSISEFIEAVKNKQNGDLVLNQNEADTMKSLRESVIALYCQADFENVSQLNVSYMKYVANNIFENKYSSNEEQYYCDLFSKYVVVNEHGEEIYTISSQIALDGDMKRVLIVNGINAKNIENYLESVDGFLISLNEKHNLLSLKNATSSATDQINFLYRTSFKNVENIEKYFVDFSDSEEAVKQLKLQNPINFIKSENEAKGFNENGDLVVVYDKHGNYIAIDYENYYDGNEMHRRISKVYDRNEREISFKYNHKNCLSEITDANGRTVKYSYTGDLYYKVEYPGGYALNFYFEGGNVRVTGSDKLRYSMNVTDGKLRELIHSSLTSRLYHGGTEANDNGYAELSRLTFTYDCTNADYVITTVNDSEALTNNVYVIDNETERLINHCVEKNNVVISAEKYDFDDSGTKTYTVTKAKKEALYKNPFSTFTFVEGDYSQKTTSIFNYVVSDKVVAYEGDLAKIELTEYEYTTNDKVCRAKTIYTIEHLGIVQEQNVSITIYEYDKTGALLSKKSYVEGEEATNGVSIEEYTYDNNGTRTRTVTYNSLDPSSKLYVESEFDENGRKIIRLDSTGRYKTRFVYDGDSVSSKIYPNGSEFSCGNSKLGENSAITMSTENGEESSVQILRTNGLATKVKSGNDEYEFEYDNKGRKTLVKLNGTVIAQCSYIDGNSTEQSFIVEKGTTTISTKSKSGESDTVVKNTDNGSKEVVKFYDNMERLSSIIEDSDGSVAGTTYEYDGLDRVVSCERTCDNQTSREEYTYDVYGNVSSKVVTNVNGTETYNYVYSNDSKRQLNSVTMSNANLTIVPKRDILGRSTGKKIGTVIDDTVSYVKYGNHATNMPSSITYKDGTRISYKYDSMGNICEVYENGQLVTEYKYDALGRLVRENNKKLNTSYVMKYDNKGNITFSGNGMYSRLSTEELEDQEKIWYSRYRYDSLGRLERLYSQDIVYLADGRCDRYLGTPVVWNGKEMVEFGENTFEYDAAGRRTAKNNTVFTYDVNGRLIKQSDGISFIYDHESLIGFEYVDSTYFYRRDILGNVIAILDSSGTVVVEYTYDAWGKFQIEGNSVIGNINPYRYRGYYFDTETALYYLKNRYYNPDVGRFISMDDVAYLDPETIGGTNLYAYCGNDPVNRIDPTGNAWYHWLIGAGIIVACAALTVVTAGGFATAGTAFASVLTATVAPTALSAAFAGATIGAMAIGTAGIVIGGTSGKNGWSWENASQGFMIGSIAGAVVGGAWGGTHYALQNAGKMAIRININNLANNPLDEFVTIGPRDGGISNYVRSISQTGDYGQIFASKLSNGMYQIANGHHRVAALRQLGYKFVNIFLVP